MWHNWGRFDFQNRLETTKRKDVNPIVLAWIADGDFTPRQLYDEWHRASFDDPNFDFDVYNSYYGSEDEPCSLDNDIMGYHNNFAKVYDVETEEFRWEDVAANPKYDQTRNEQS